MHHKAIISILLLVLAVGCSRSTTPDTSNPASSAQAENQVVAQTKPPPPPPPESSTESASAKNAKAAAKSARNAEPESPTPRPGMTLEKAQVGSGDKGRGYEPGIITTPVSTYFAARERIMFEIQIPEFIRAYKFEHDFKGPPSNEEFMKMLKKNSVELPTLPPGHRYVYDPKTEELMVERPEY